MEEVQEIRKTGEWYTIRGVVDGRKVEYGIPAQNIEGKPEKQVREALRRDLRTVAEAERAGG